MALLGKQVRKTLEKIEDEMLSLLPRFDGKHVLVMGVQIEYLTDQISKRTSSVRAFNLSLPDTEKSERDESSQTISQLSPADISQLELPQNSFDLIVMNQLLMHLSSEQVESFVVQCLGWLKNEGFLFFRESFSGSSGQVDEGNKQRVCRSPVEYTTALHMAMIPAENEEKNFTFEISLSKMIDSGNTNHFIYDDICWLAKKVSSSGKASSSCKTRQKLFDMQVFTRNMILQYETIFGRNFISTGAKVTTEQFVKLLDLKPKQEVLDVGSGIGGSAFYMAETYDVNVTGIDLCFNMVSMSWERAKEINEKRVQFLVADATKIDFEPELFDVVFSRDVIMHIPNKSTLFARFFNWLKPGGKLLIVDYFCSDGEHTDQYRCFIQEMGYTLYSFVEYGKMLEEVGFVNVKFDDQTDLYIKFKDEELERLESNKNVYIQKFCQAEYDVNVREWEDKRHHCQEGSLRWGLIRAEKKK